VVSIPFRFLQSTDNKVVKKWLRRNWHRFQDDEFPEIALLEICMEAVTAEKAQAWFRHSGYL
jgi:hypothetical protein